MIPRFGFYYCLFLVFMVLEMEPKASCPLAKHYLGATSRILWILKGGSHTLFMCVSHVCTHVTVHM